jgi:hypothetical protein
MSQAHRFPGAHGPVDATRKTFFWGRNTWDPTEKQGRGRGRRLIIKMMSPSGGALTM